MKVFRFLLLPLVFAGCLAEVVNDFNSNACRGFFASPNGGWSTPTTFRDNHYKRICQTLKGVGQFATFYDTAHKIPVYSAFKFTGITQCGRKSNWFIEPQLDDRTLSSNMASENTVPKLVRGKNQALNSDYSKSGFDKGHLFPVRLATSQSCSDATFTLTNAAPQSETFNRGQWSKAEGCLTGILDTYCKSLSAHVVTGVVPGSNTMKDTSVRVPSHFWTAFCCLDNNNRAIFSGGFYGENSNEEVKYVSVADLEQAVTRAYNKGPFQVFGGGCHVTAPVTSTHPTSSRKRKGDSSHSPPSKACPMSLSKISG